MIGVVMMVTSLLVNSYTYSLELMSFLEVVFFQDDHRTLLCRRSVTTPGSWFSCCKNLGHDFHVAKNRGCLQVAYSPVGATAFYVTWPGCQRLFSLSREHHGPCESAKCSQKGPRTSGHDSYMTGSQRQIRWRGSPCAKTECIHQCGFGWGTYRITFTSTMFKRQLKRECRTQLTPCVVLFQPRELAKHLG